MKKTQSGKYHCTVYVGLRADGSRRYESFTASSRAQLRADASAFRLKVAQLRAKGVPVDDIPRDGEPVRRDTVENCLENYLSACRAARLSPSTLATYDRLIRRSYGKIKGLPVCSLNLAQIQTEVNEMQTLSPKTVRCTVALLGAALKTVRPDLNLRLLKLPRQQRAEIAIPSTEDVRRMLAEAEGDALYIPLCLAALMGLRRSEICALRWSDVDRKKKALHVGSAIVRGEYGTYTEKGTKTAAGDRVLPIPASLFRVLVKSRGLDEHVTSLTPDAITRRFERLTARLGLRARFHDLRHYHASMMLAVGAPEKYICADMGHASIDMVRRVYGHVMADRQQEINAQMDAAATDMLARAK